MVKTLNISLDDDEHEALAARKGSRSWRDFLLDECLPDSPDNGSDRDD